MTSLFRYCSECGKREDLCVCTDIKEQERISGFPCVCGATDYEDAADKCEGISDDNICPAVYMFENYIAVEDKEK